MNVTFEERPSPHGYRIGIATLDAEKSLNALSLSMIKALDDRLKAWADDPEITCVMLRGNGPKAFCAGGDVVQLVHQCREHPGEVPPLARRFFADEYRLDHRIHTYPKPFICWAHGHVLGGGMGLMQGAGIRIVTPSSRLGMPEINIGLYPDVGGSWFLRRAPGRTGLFLAFTAAQVNGSDAIFAGLADVLVPHARKGQVLEAIGATAWSGEQRADRALLSRILAAAAEGAERPASKLREHYETIESLMVGEDLLDIAKRLRTLQSDDAWLQGAAKAFAKGAPSSIALTWALWQRVPRMSLAEVFRLEYWASLGFCAHHDFAEGIRAVLVDKDRNPKWQPATLEEITPAFVDDHLRERGEMAPELVALR